MAMTDPKTGARMVDAVYKADDIYSGEFKNERRSCRSASPTADRVSWQSSLGGSPPGLVHPNMKKWSGDHGSFDYRTTPGTLISSRPLADGRGVPDHRHRPDSAEILRLADTVGYRWTAPVLTRGFH